MVCSSYPDKACLSARTTRCHHSRSLRQTQYSRRTASCPLPQRSAPCLPHHQTMVHSVLSSATRTPTPSTVLSASFLRSTATVITSLWSIIRMGGATPSGRTISAHRTSMTSAQSQPSNSASPTTANCLFPNRLVTSALPLSRALVRTRVNSSQGCSTTTTSI